MTFGRHDAAAAAATAAPFAMQQAYAAGGAQLPADYHFQQQLLQQQQQFQQQPYAHPAPPQPWAAAPFPVSAAASAPFTHPALLPPHPHHAHHHPHHLPPHLHPPPQAPTSHFTSPAHAQFYAPPQRNMVNAVRVALSSAPDVGSALQGVPAPVAAAAAAALTSFVTPKCAWFNMKSIHRNEMTALPEFFMQPPPPSPSLSPMPPLQPPTPDSASGFSPSVASMGGGGAAAGAASHGMAALPSPLSSSGGSSSRSRGGGGGGGGRAVSTGEASLAAGSAAVAPFSPAAAMGVSVLQQQPPQPVRKLAEFVYNPFRTPQVYKDYRDWMYLTYHSNPCVYLHVTTCLKFLVGDFASIMRVHRALEGMELINVPGSVAQETKPSFLCVPPPPLPPVVGV